MWRLGSAPRFSLISFAVALLIFFSSVTTQGQTASHIREPQRNFTPAGSFSLSDFESINTTNGNLILRFPLGQLPPGRSALRGGFYLHYNSKLYDTFIGPSTDITGQTSLQNLLRDSIEAGWQLHFRYELSVANRNNEIDGGYQNVASSSCNSQSNALATYIWKVKIRFPDGSEHLFRPSGYADERGDGYFNVDTFGDVRFYSCSPVGTGCSCTYTQGTDPNPRMTYYSADGSYLRLTIERNQDWTLYYPDGSKVVSQGPSQRVFDRNGNFYDIINNTIIDDAGRSVSLTRDLATGDDLITQTGVGGAPLVWRIKWKTISIVNKAYSSTAVPSSPLEHGNTAIQQWTGDYTVVDKIILPTQLGELSYTFNYDTTAGWGEVSSVVMPADTSETPPQVTYQYSYPGPPANGLPTSASILRGYASTKTLIWQAESDGTTAPITETWSYSINSTVTFITAPDGGITTESHGDTSRPTIDTGLVKRIERPDGSKTERIWAVNSPPWLGSIPPTMSERNAFVKTEFNSIKDAGGNYAKTAIKDFVYDKNGNALQVTEYAWIDYSLVPRDASGFPTGIPGGLTPMRVTLNTYNNATPDCSTPGNHANAYWNIAPPGGYTTLTLNAIASKEIRTAAGGTVHARTEYTYDDPATTANLTVTRNWDSEKGPLKPSPPLLDGTNSIAVTNQYGTYSTGATGKLIRAIDANGVATSYSYGDIGNGVTDIYITQTIAAEGAAVARTSESKYDFHTGVVIEAKDADNNVITKTTFDVFGRPTLIQEALGIAGHEKRTAIEYSDTLRRVITRSDLNTAGDGKLIAVQHYDQLGRICLTRRLESGNPAEATDKTKGVKIQTRYFAGDASNQNDYELVSAPYRATTSGEAGGEPGMAWKRTKFDKGGRVIEGETFIGATPPVPWGSNSVSSGKFTTEYDAEYTTVTDQAGKKRRSRVDALGRLVRVDEPDAVGNLGATSAPVQPTNYAYNALDNLIQTTQTGVPNGGSSPVTQTRTFTFSSLGRLISANNPESGPISHEYDANGNLKKKTDARNVVINYTYDELNRNRTVDYSNTAVNPDITRVYDNPAPLAYGKGKFWKDYAGGDDNNGQNVEHKEVDRYDALGRPLSVRRKFKNNGVWSPAFTTSQTYDLAGHVKTKTYPSGRGVTYTYDVSGDLTSFTGNIGDGVSRTYSTGIQYNPQGQLIREQFGTSMPLYHRRHYNSRGQLFDVRLGTDSSAINDGPNPAQWTGASWNRGALRMFFSSNLIEYAWPAVAPQANNGNLQRQDHFVPTALDGGGTVTGWVMSADYYCYDSLNRVAQTAEETYTSVGGYTPNVFNQQFSYDRFGNRLVGSATGTGVPNPGFKINGANNRLIAPTDADGVQASDRMRYDASGNLIKDTHTQTGTGGNRIYDAENRMTSADGANGLANSYAYDADGHRTRRSIDSGDKIWWQVFGISGELVGEYQLVSGTPTLKKEYGYRNGQLLVIAETTGTCQWLVTDALGTPRMIADQTGSLSAMKRRDYLPFGEEILVGVGHRQPANGYSLAQSQQPRQQFTGKDRDPETNLDYFDARYYGSLYGRFTSPDEFTGGPDELYDFADAAADNPTFYADLIDPQSLNKYQYCYNNPLTTVDPDGHKGWRERLSEAAQAVGDYVAGVGRGIAASVSYGLVGGPSSNDSLASRLGQHSGTGIVAGVGVVSTGAGGGVILGTGGAATLTVAPAVAVVGGVALIGGAVKNQAALNSTPIQSSSNSQQSSGSSQQGTSKTPTEMANDLSKQTGKNRAIANTPNKQVRIDLNGKPHFDKSTKTNIPTPHVHESKINRGPNGQVSTSNKTTRPATKADIRVARKILEEN
jgi:RHS repeat-associated protein